MPEEVPRRTTIILTTRDQENLAYLMGVHETSATHSIRRALSVAKIIEEWHAAGGKVIFEKDGKQETQRLI